MTEMGPPPKARRPEILRAGLLILGVWGIGVAALTFGGRGSFLHAMLSGLAFMASILGALVGVMMLIFAKSSAQQILGWQLAGTSAFVASLMAASVSLGQQLSLRDVEEAKAYCERLRPAIAAHRSRTGDYPESLADLPSNPPVPRLLVGTDLYRRTPDGYEFSIILPQRIFAVLIYSSLQDRWHESD